MNCGKVSRAQAVGIVLVFLAAFLCAILLTNCATMKLERRLAPELRDWYRQHEI